MDIVFCDNHLLVVVKPPGLLTQPDPTGDKSLEEQVKAWVKKEYHKPGAVFLHVIHRLDRPASGLVFFARTSKSLSRLNEQSREGAIQRVYWVEVEGALPENEARLDHYIIHAEHRAVLGKKEDKEAKHARLFYRVKHRLSLTTIAEVELETGRYHQIRCQFSAIGHPILGDVKYGAKNGDGSAIHLHCAKLLFEHPVTQEKLCFESHPPFCNLNGV
ncbi:MAG: RNA pseudouridine synthase [Chlamydiia bacterium]|nr:RNA pseudouridine synthase [Chlamydiia bacterium]